MHSVSHRSARPALPHRRRRTAPPWLLLLVLLPLLLCLLAPAGYGQQRANRRERQKAAPMAWDFRDFANPEKFLEQFFGEETEQDRRRLASVTVSPAEERECGQRALQAFLGELQRNRIDTTARGKDVDYLRRLVALVHSQMDNAERYTSWELYIAESEQTDARCFPGGTLVIFRGLLDFARSEAAMVGVIGHELSHVDRGHQLQLLRRMKVAEQTFAGGGGFDLQQFLQNGTLLMRAFSRPFRPEDESQADHDAATWAFQLGYDPREFADLFRRMHERGPQPNGMLPAFLRSHPFHIDRHRAVLDVFRDMSATHPEAELYVGRENLRQRLTRDQRRFPE